MDPAPAETMSVEQLSSRVGMTAGTPPASVARYPIAPQPNPWRRAAVGSLVVRAVVRRAGSAPVLGVTEHVGDFADEGLAREVTKGADAVITTGHPIGSARRCSTGWRRGHVGSRPGCP